MITKLAIVTDDGVTIHQHFGQARYFKILTLEDGVVKSAEIREKAIHEHGQMPSDGIHPGQKMIDSISDCQVLISGGMGEPVFQRAESTGLRVVLTHYQDIDLAVQAYQAGTLESDLQLVHQH
ncbi:MAG: NifB/NifX family molybdenum-iron cluster-binding protein [Anaerolineaceae bacterium]